MIFRRTEDQAERIRQLEELCRRMSSRITELRAKRTFSEQEDRMKREHLMDLENLYANALRKLGEMRKVA